VSVKVRLTFICMIFIYKL